jgi:hypothetical protein
MTKFWIGAAALIFVGALTLMMPSGNSSVLVNDLETECRHDRPIHDIHLNSDDSLSFTGNFPVANTESEVSYSYSGGKSIVLNINVDEMAVPETFWDACLGSAVYDIDTQTLEPGRYSVELKHDGERVEKQVIRVE